jgi:hypothetical protein
MRDLLACWQRINPEPLTAQQLCDMVRERLELGMGEWRPRYPDLQEAAIQVMGDLPKWGARELGYRLRSMSGRVFAGLRVVKCSKGMGGAQWRVESLGA